jgi:hypothetical protein
MQEVASTTDIQMDKTAPSRTFPYLLLRSLICISDSTAGKVGSPCWTGAKQEPFNWLE